ncbi:MAG: TIM barrel protein, partial [Pseudomonadota bacterium]
MTISYSKLSLNPIGVMQGRLLPKYQGRYQAHPVGYWQEEFPLAADLGLDCIEFILDANDVKENPLLRPDGPEEILRVADETGVAVRTVCADIFMEAPLHELDENIASYGQGILSRLLDRGHELRLTDIVIPCVDKSSMLDLSARQRFVNRLRHLVEKAEALAINLALETDLSPEPFAELLQTFGS